MNIMSILVISVVVLYVGYKLYTKFIEKVFEVDNKNITPSVEINDGVDYVPTRKFVIFGHHFASIAGGGPIIGPTVAMAFGYLPVWLWLLFGAVLIGGVHDFTALLTSIREKGKSIAEIAEKTLGKKGFLLMIAFTIFMLIMVTSVFLTLTSTALSSKYPLSYFGTNNIEVQTVVENGVPYAVIGGVASTSVMIITGLAPLVGFLLYKKKISTLLVSLLAIAICAVSVEIGLMFPLKINPTVWMVILSFYTLLAAGVPVWIVLQPRDFTNSFMLYAGIIALFIGSVIGLTVTLWLKKKGKTYWFVLLPGIFMLVTTIAALVQILFEVYIPKANYALMLGDILLLLLSVGVIIMFIKTYMSKNTGTPVTPEKELQHA